MTYEWHGNDKPPEFDQTLADSYVGKYILVGITYYSPAGEPLERRQLHGVIESASLDGINISLKGVHVGEMWNMPPVLQAIYPAKPGAYELHSTGETVENPDLLSTWDVTKSDQAR